jgi:DNA replication and repair protein RecF
VNGVARRASDLIGRLRVVMFSAEDLAIIEGAPAGRRRYLDITISQLEPVYVRALQRYGRVLQQRNSLLRGFRERRHDPTELDFWDSELAAASAVILEARARLLARLDALAAERHAELSPRAEALSLGYRPAIPPDLNALLGEPDLETALRAAFEANRRADLQRGATQIGPHRDDVAILLGGHEAGAFASRGEQRTLALALRLAEVALSSERTSDAPVLLLDDILSELDSERRGRVLAAAYGVDQVLITTPDDDRPAADELPAAKRYRLVPGLLEPG